jgi:hypothetical protein
VTGLVIHVSEDLGTTDSNTIGTSKHSLGDKTAKLEPGRHVGQKTGLVGQVNELESVLKLELEDLKVSSAPFTRRLYLQYTPKGSCRQHRQR